MLPVAEPRDGIRRGIGRVHVVEALLLLLVVLVLLAPWWVRRGLLVLALAGLLLCCGVLSAMIGA